jgi:hypothetical protein
MAFLNERVHDSRGYRYRAFHSKVGVTTLSKGLQAFIIIVDQRNDHIAFLSDAPFRGAHSYFCIYFTYILVLIHCSHDILLSENAIRYPSLQQRLIIFTMSKQTPD